MLKGFEKIDEILKKQTPILCGFNQETIEKEYNFSASDLYNNLYFKVISIKDLIQRNFENLEVFIIFEDYIALMTINEVKLNILKTILNIDIEPLICKLLLFYSKKEGIKKINNNSIIKIINLLNKPPILIDFEFCSNYNSKYGVFIYNYLKKSGKLFYLHQKTKLEKIIILISYNNNIYFSQVYEI